MENVLNVTSKIGKLTTVLLHRPGEEVDNLTPEYLQKLFSDDTPFLPILQKEHDFFAQTLRENDVEVLYLTSLVAEALYKNELNKQFILNMLNESINYSPIK